MRRCLLGSAADSELLLGGLDYAVLALYLACVATIGFRASRGQQTTEDYFLGRRGIPWWAAGLSIIATETSALTFIGAPTQSLLGNWGYIQLAFGSVLARFLVAGILIGAYYRANVTTVYGFLEQRFGVLSKNASSVLFFAGRILGSGVRLYGAAIALVIVADISFPLAILLIALVAVAYTVMGGIRSVIYTDVLQGMLLVGGALCALGFLLVEHGGTEAFEVLSNAKTAAGEGKLAWLNLSLDPREAYTLWGGLFGIVFLTAATHGTDQDMVQRALTCRNEGAGKKSLWLSAALSIPIVAIFLAVGSLLWLHYGGDDGAARAAAELAASAGETDPKKGFDYLFPFYVVTTLPTGIKGLIVAGIFAASMSSLDSAISALATTATTSFWRPYYRPKATGEQELRASRRFSLLFGLILCGVALVVWQREESGSAAEGFGVLMLGLKVLTWIFPPLLGVFLVGVLTKRGSDPGNLVALSTGISMLLVVEFWTDLFPIGSAMESWIGHGPPFAWTWNSMIGCLVTFAIAVGFKGRSQK